MSSKLAITDLKVAGRRKMLPDLVDGHRDIWFDINIDIHNTGNTPCYVIDELRGLEYDEPSQTLIIRLCESDPGSAPKNAPNLRPVMPRTIQVKPHGKATITVAVPAELKTLYADASFSFKTKSVDLLEMKKIRCTMVSSEHPIELHPTESLHEMRHRLTQWGDSVTREVSVGSLRQMPFIKSAVNLKER